MATLEQRRKELLLTCGLLQVRFAVNTRPAYDTLEWVYGGVAW